MLFGKVPLLQKRGSGTAHSERLRAGEDSDEIRVRRLRQSSRATVVGGVHWIVWLAVGWIVLSVVVALIAGRAIRIAGERERESQPPPEEPLGDP